MGATSASPVRPFDDAYLVAYSEEHIAYEFDMFLWLAEVCGNPRVKLDAASPADAIRLRNVLIEAFVVHLRNIIDFLYLDSPKPSDVVAADFLHPGVWQRMRPAISATLNAARRRANKELAHLTTDRITGTPPQKAWAFSALAGEVRALIGLFAENASQNRLSPSVAVAMEEQRGR